MGSVYSYETKAGKRWEARYRRPDGKTARKAAFARKRDAEAFLATVEVSKLHGSYISPSDARAIIDQLGAEWLAAHQTAVKPSTFHSDESAWRIHVQPMWGGRAVGSIRHTEVAAWISKIARDKSATTVKRVHGVLAAILDTAVKDQRIASNPARDVKTPRKVSKPRAYLSVIQVEHLVAEAKYPLIVLLLAYTGLRWGEAAGLRVKHLKPSQRRLEIQENAVFVNGRVQIGTPKTHERRSVPYPAFFDDGLAKACSGKHHDALVFHNADGKHLSPGNARDGWFASAVKRCMQADPEFPRLTPHDLRHTAASLAISAGANVKVVQRMLGHASAAMTLDRYADLFPDDLDAVAEALGRRRKELLEVTLQ